MGRTKEKKSKNEIVKNKRIVENFNPGWTFHFLTINSNIFIKRFIVA